MRQNEGNKTHQAFEVPMTVHIRHPDRERWEAVLIQCGFTDILRDPPPVDLSRRYINSGRTHTARSIVALVQAVFLNPAYALSGTSSPLDLLS